MYKAIITLMALGVLGIFLLASSSNTPTHVSFPEEPIAKGDTLVKRCEKGTIVYEFYHHYESQRGQDLVIAQ